MIIILAVSSITTSNQLSIRILYGVYLFACFILSNVYSSLFYSVITVPTLGKPIDTLADLISATSTDSVRLAFKDNAIFKTAIYTSSPKNFIYHHLLQHCLRRAPIMFTNQREIIPLVESSQRVVLIAQKIKLYSRRYLEAKVPLHISSESIKNIFIGWAVGRKSPLKEPFDLVIKQHQEGGLLKKLLQNTVRRLKLTLVTRGKLRANLYVSDKGSATLSGAQQTSSFDPLSFSELSAIFFFYAYALAFIFAAPFLLGEVLRKQLLK